MRQSLMNKVIAHRLDLFSLVVKLGCEIDFGSVSACCSVSTLRHPPGGVVHEQAKHYIAMTSRMTDEDA